MLGGEVLSVEKKTYTPLDWFEAQVVPLYLLSFFHQSSKNFFIKSGDLAYPLQKIGIVYLPNPDEPVDSNHVFVNKHAVRALERVPVKKGIPGGGSKWLEMRVPE